MATSPLAFNYNDHPAQLGVGVISFNRASLLESCLEQIRKNTAFPIDLIVADDGSTDGCVKMLRDRNVPFVTGMNRGIAWNKNRALIALLEYSKADVILLMENDCHPVGAHWAETWHEAVSLHGHINCLHPRVSTELAAGRTPEAIMGGSGTPRDPYICKTISGICIGSSRQALTRVGFFDTRFKGYGHEHAEWTTRFHKEGYGAHWYNDVSGPRKANLMIQGGLIGLNEPSSSDKSMCEKNHALYLTLKREPNYRPPWRTDDERQVLLKELAAASELRTLVTGEVLGKYEHPNW